MMASLSDSSLKQYDSGLRKWWSFNVIARQDPFHLSIETLLLFLTEEYEKRASYGSLNTMRSAIALLHGPEVGENTHVRRFFKGISRLRPPRPKYESTWDPEIVLSHLRLWGPTEDLVLEKLSQKLVVLLALTTAQRMQTLSLIDIRNIVHKSDHIEIKVPNRLKTSDVGRIQPTLIIPYYTHERLLCPASILKHYLEKTGTMKDSENRLFISFKNPHKAVTPQTLSRWIKRVLGSSELDISCYSAYSTRHASTSVANRDGITIDTIIKTAGWTQKSNTFAKFYKRPVICEKTSFALTVLDSTRK